MSPPMEYHIERDGHALCMTYQFDDPDHTLVEILSPYSNGILDVTCRECLALFLHEARQG